MAPPAIPAKTPALMVGCVALRTAHSAGCGLRVHNHRTYYSTQVLHRPHQPRCKRGLWSE